MFFYYNAILYTQLLLFLIYFIISYYSYVMLQHFFKLIVQINTYIMKIKLVIFFKLF